MELKRTSRRILAGAILALGAPAGAQRAAPPQRLPPLDSSYPFRRCPRSRRATRATRSRRGSTPDAPHDRGHARAGLAQHDRRAAAELPVPPLLERLPQQPLDLGPRRRAAARPRFEVGRPRVRLHAGPHDRARRRAGRGGSHRRRCATSSRTTATRTTARWPRSRARGPCRRTRPCASAWPGPSRVPYGDVGRAGWVHDYHFVVQWFPKIAGTAGGRFVAHQFHPHSEFFSDFGVYDVRLTLPRGFVVGATGRQESKTENPDGTATFRFRQEDVHDFAWTASRRYLDRRGRFEDPGYPPVEIRLLLQPEHAHLGGALPRGGPHRAAQLRRLVGALSRTRRSRSSTPPGPRAPAGWSTRRSSPAAPTASRPPVLQSPESVTIHESGHQFWYGLVANNEFEEAWLDEGFNRYHDRKAAVPGAGARRAGARRYFGLARAAARVRLAGGGARRLPAHERRPAPADCGGRAGRTRWRGRPGATCDTTPGASTATASPRCRCTRSRGCWATRR